MTTKPCRTCADPVGHPPAPAITAAAPPTPAPTKPKAPVSWIPDGMHPHEADACLPHAGPVLAAGIEAMPHGEERDDVASILAAALAGARYAAVHGGYRVSVDQARVAVEEMGTADALVAAANPYAVPPAPQALTAAGTDNTTISLPKPPRVTPDAPATPAPVGFAWIDMYNAEINDHARRGNLKQARDMAYAMVTKLDQLLANATDAQFDLVAAAMDYPPELAAAQERDRDTNLIFDTLTAAAKFETTPAVLPPDLADGLHADDVKGLEGYITTRRAGEHDRAARHAAQLRSAATRDGLRLRMAQRRVMPAPQVTATNFKAPAAS